MALHRDPGQQCQVQRVHHLAVHVELELADGGVAEPYGPGALVAGQPAGHRLGHHAFPRDAVHRLEVARVAGDGPQQPLAPGGRLLAEAAAQQGGERHAGVAQPAEPVVPVALAADPLGQGRRRGGDDAAGRRVREGLEGEQRAQDGFAPLAPVVAVGRPVLPAAEGGEQGLVGFDPRGVVQVGGLPGEDEGGLSAGRDGEVGGGGAVGAVGVHARRDA